MIVSDRRRRLEAQRAVKDIEPGDLVRQIGFRGTGLIESVDNDHAVVAWNGHSKSILPLATLRRVQAAGAHLDSKKP
jgi:hypothetical protein